MHLLTKDDFLSKPSKETVEERLEEPVDDSEEIAKGCKSSLLSKLSLLL